MECTCVAHHCQPGSGHFGDKHRFAVRHITEYKRECPVHGHIFGSSLAADLRYGD